jgi:hypothetical protein
LGTANFHHEGAEIRRRAINLGPRTVPVCNSSAAVISTELNAVTDVTPIMRLVDCSALGSLPIASAESLE